MNPRTGGAERTILEVGKRLVSRGHEVDLLTGGWQDAPRHEVIDGIKIHRYGHRLFPHLVQPLYLRYHDDADVIVDDMAHAAPWFSPWFSDKPGIVFFRHMHARTLKGQVSQPMASILSFLERHYSFFYKTWPFVTESNSSERDLHSLGIRVQRITKIPPGVDTSLFRPTAKTDEPSMVYFGGMRPYKRPEHALMALKLLRNRGVPVNLRMVGVGPSMPSLKQLAIDLGINGNVTFLGKLPDTLLAKVVSSSWVNVHCSMSEGWGYSMLESAAAGTPTIAYKVPGVTESVVEGINGFLVEDGDVSGLSNAVEDLFRLGVDWSGRSRRFAEQYSWESTTSRWESELKRCISMNTFYEHKFIRG